MLGETFPVWSETTFSQVLISEKKFQSAQCTNKLLKTVGFGGAERARSSLRFLKHTKQFFNLTKRHWNSKERKRLEN